MASRRQVSLAILTALSLAVFGASSAQAASAVNAHAHAHRAAHCGKAGRTHGKAGSVHFSHRPSARSHRARCRRHRAIHRGARRHTAARSLGRSRSADAQGSCQDTELHPNQENVELIRLATLCLVNHERAVHGERALRADGHLQQAAQGHTDSMAGNDYFEHEGPGGQTPLDRMRSAGYIYSSRIGYQVGENIAWGTGSLGTPRAIVAAWMASPGHRANILDPHFRDSGIGVSSHPPGSLAHGQLGGVYTQDFGVIVTS